MSTVDAAEVAAIRAAIEAFIEDRKQKKLDPLTKDRDNGKKTEEEFAREIEELDAKYTPATWLADAARRAGQIRLATHIAKATHPATDPYPGIGASCFFVDSSESFPGYVTSPGSTAKIDAVGNAAALDVYGLLTTRVGEKNLLEYVRRRSPALASAMGVQGMAHCEAFAALFEPPSTPRSHTRTKQVYFPVGNEYHLLAPMYGSTLAHAVREAIQEDRFGDEAKLAREARREGEFSAHGYVEYPGLAIQMFGSGKPQNISRLMQDRSGEGFLLPSLPPVWRFDDVSAPSYATSIFRGPFSRTVREDVKRLCEFLRDADHNNVNIRNHRDTLLDEIIDELLVYAGAIQSLTPGWSAGDCVLDEAERFWLDPYRALSDSEFANKRELTGWQAQVAGGFGRWLNFELKRAELAVGDAEQFEWQRRLEAELELLPDPIEGLETEVGDAA